MTLPHVKLVRHIPDNNVFPSVGCGCWSLMSFAAVRFLLHVKRGFVRNVQEHKSNDNNDLQQQLHLEPKQPSTVVSQHDSYKPSKRLS